MCLRRRSGWWIKPWYWLLTLFAPASRCLQSLLLVVPPLLVLMCHLETLTTVRGAGQTWEMRPVALRTLPLRQHSTDDTLSGAGHDHISHVQELRGENLVIQLELSTKPCKTLQCYFNIHEVLSSVDFSQQHALSYEALWTFISPWQLKNQSWWSSLELDTAAWCGKTLIKQFLDGGHHHVGILLHQDLIVVRCLSTG